MTEYKKIISLIDEYLNKKMGAEESDKFCNLYMEKFYTKSDDLEKELPQKLFEILDDLNLICDSYEKNPDIRNDDKFCIDEIQLREKVLLHLDELKNYRV